MHAMLGHLDMRKMSGIKRVLPWTNWLMLIGCAALAGFPLTSGFFSKDSIVDATLHYNVALWAALLFTAFLTSYYTFRLYFRVFTGPLLVPDAPAEPAAPAHDDHSHDDHGHDDHAHHNHEPMIMILPLIILSLGAIFGGLFNVPGHALGDFLGRSPSFRYSFEVAQARVGESPQLTEGFGQPAAEAASGVPVGLIVGGAVSIAGILLAAYLHLINRPADDRLVASLQPIPRILEAKYWVDEFYQAYIVETLRGIGDFCYAVDNYIVDSLIAIVAWIPKLGGYILRLTTERGYLQGYAAVMLLGLAAILLFIFA
jgi:NADH-quinone oxidoreductase subunit L